MVIYRLLETCEMLFKLPSFKLFIIAIIPIDNNKLTSLLKGSSCLNFIKKI